MIVVNENTCIGCEACVNICPKKCITMKQNSEGFYLPVVNKDECINCSACNRVCICEQKISAENSLLNCYAAISKKDDERMKSSSGGVFSLLADYILANNGIVYGASFSEDLSVHHIRVSNKDDLKKLRGSKYVQSHIDNSFLLAKKDLENGKRVLFSGTGCQIDSLKLFLQKEYVNLLTVDVACYGVPSEKVWFAYMQCNKINSLPIEFRNKDIGWLNYSVKYGEKEPIEHSKDLYMNIFLSKLALRNSCYSCQSKGCNRNSDLTLADFWGIDSIDKEMFDNKGTSLVIVHSEKGQKAFDSISTNLTFKQEDVNEAITHNPYIVKSVEKPKARDEFLAEFNQCNPPSLKHLYNKYVAYYDKNTFQKLKILIKKLIKF
ncbi:MAG: Coenzyme F420 hydrogenase/dehydrogenase, beta subunit C-terminal domain [Acetobacter sp.]|nr:Coenzyme F420 hydrogenase/dehydrogenase, beta subunit C-terminal domain [Bacteroides sp.]MCM1341554.1 Coenzyme F420 hydrogenase/dehydrogenase, beta subunit C-terminal domain [Acetobacter sp.]MCM1433631.1 Coenzyme F420 hydrogenase/dehydrogenase, beta subunit C-terminal domain [Clostridiales bacterium]